ncbi:calcium homeostasis modulator protein 6-like [Ptychodera flava]|uniref:calcium homeostasis modulator protein 6-like n=1 Tax=Ptychodera flava TaxID=63121 RepID=UPI00396A0368
MAAEGFFTQVGRIVKANRTAIQNLMIVLLVFGGKKFFEVAIFKCPCDPVRREFYSWMFIVGPAITLYVLGVLVNNKTWRIVTGCCQASNGCVEFCKTRKVCSGGCFGLFEVSFRALVGSFAWLVLAFMNSIFYACAVSTSLCQEGQDSPQLDESDKALSQSIGWVLLVGSSLLLLVLLLLWRMCSSYTYEQRRYAKLYAEVERQKFLEKAQVWQNSRTAAKYMISRGQKQMTLYLGDLFVVDAGKRVDETLEMFFSQEDLKIEDRDGWKKACKAWSNISLVGSKYMADCGYTTLHEWAILQRTGKGDIENPDGDASDHDQSENVQDSTLLIGATKS